MTSKYERYFEGTNFGSTDYNYLVLEGLMNIACGYCNGMTLNCILESMGFTKSDFNGEVSLTMNGQTELYYLWEQSREKL